MRNNLAKYFISELIIPGSGLITITRVEVTNDLKLAKIYISFFKNKQHVSDLIDIIISKKNNIRNYVGQNVVLKYIPKLRFYYDNSIDHADKINTLLKKI